MKLMAVRTAVEHETGSTCWCCGAGGDAARMVRLGNHPEVALCVGCAHWASKQAWEIEDGDRAGVRVAARNRFRQLRRSVVQRGLHNHPVLGRPLRWLGRRLP